MIKEIKLEDFVIDLLGPLGKKFQEPVQSYKDKNPGNVVLEGAEVFIFGKKYWYGDIDITLYKKRLEAIAQFCNKKIFIIKKDNRSFEIYTIKPK